MLFLSRTRTPHKTRKIRFFRIYRYSLHPTLQTTTMAPSKHVTKACGTKCKTPPVTPTSTKKKAPPKKSKTVKKQEKEDEEYIHLSDEIEITEEEVKDNITEESAEKPQEASIATPTNTSPTESPYHTPFSADRIWEEKAMVCFESNLKKTKRTSPIWSFFRTIESTLYHDPEVQDFPGLRKILAAQQNNKDIVVT